MAMIPRPLFLPLARIDSGLFAFLEFVLDWDERGPDENLFCKNVRRQQKDWVESEQNKCCRTLGTNTRATAQILQF